MISLDKKIVQFIKDITRALARHYLRVVFFKQKMVHIFYLQTHLKLSLFFFSCKYQHFY